MLLSVEEEQEVLSRCLGLGQTWGVLILQSHRAAAWEKSRLFNVLRPKLNGMKERGVFAHLD